MIRPAWRADEAGGATRLAAAKEVLNSGLLNVLKEKFQVRLYRLSDHLDRFDKLDPLTAQPLPRIWETV